VVNFLYINIDLLNCIVTIVCYFCPDFPKWLEAFILALKKLWNLKSHVKCPKFKIPLPRIEISYQQALEDVIIPAIDRPAERIVKKSPEEL
jgi:hypothetical protein